MTQGQGHVIVLEASADQLKGPRMNKCAIIAICHRPTQREKA